MHAVVVAVVVAVGAAVVVVVALYGLVLAVVPGLLKGEMLLLLLHYLLECSCSP